MKEQKITEKTFHEASALLLQDVMREEEACAEQHEPSPEFREKMERLLRDGGQQDPGGAREKPSSQTRTAKKGGKKITLKAILIIAAVMCVFAIVVSAGNNKPGVTPTGYPNGEVQRQFLFYNGTLYVFIDEGVRALPEGWQEVGTVKSVDNKARPTEEFAATRLEVGMKVFAKEGTDLLYVQEAEHEFGKFEPAGENAGVWFPPYQ